MSITPKFLKFFSDALPTHSKRTQIFTTSISRNIPLSHELVPDVKINYVRVLQCPLNPEEPATQGHMQKSTDCPPKGVLFLKRCHCDSHLLGRLEIEFKFLCRVLTLMGQGFHVHQHLSLSRKMESDKYKFSLLYVPTIIVCTTL